jgi:formylglycine-generating enzyme required for sulfatase activity
VFVLLPSGTYRRGGKVAAEYADLFRPYRPIHEVKLTDEFYISETEITNEEFRTYRPSHDSGDLLDEVNLNEPNHPAVRMTWFDATKFCEHYDYRLPSEAEWEYACRAGIETDHFWGDDAMGGKEFANMSDESLMLLRNASMRKIAAANEIAQPSRKEPLLPVKSDLPWNDGFPGSAPVRKFKPNGFGLFDMSGNVKEWCSDWYADHEYERHVAGAVDPKGPEVGSDRVLRGGSWNMIANSYSSFGREHRRPTWFNADIGFRVVVNVSRVRSDGANN